jgi:hypothetical protein
VLPEVYAFFLRCQSNTVVAPEPVQDDATCLACLALRNMMPEFFATQDVGVAIGNLRALQRINLEEDTHGPRDVVREGADEQKETTPTTEKLREP